MKKPKIKNRVINVIFMGKRLDGKDLPYSIFLHGKREIAFSRCRGYYDVGTTYALKISEDKHFLFPKHGLEQSKIQRKVDEKDIVKWEMETDLAEQERKYIIERKKLETSKEWLAALAPIKKEYSKANRARKAAIELAIVYYLRQLWLPLSEKKGND